MRLDADRVVDAGGGRPPADAEDLGEVAILPGLVNAHTHLELSSLAGRVPPAASLVEWIRRLMSERASATGGEIEIARAAERSLRVAQAAGTVLFGDISNTLLTLPLLASNEAGGVVFHELVGFRAHDPGAVVSAAWEKVDARGRESGLGARAHLSAGVVAHAPYSVSPQLFSAIAWSQRDVPLSVHLGESAEELEFLQTGRGPFRELLEQLGAWVPGWTPPGRDPVHYLADLGYLTPGCLVVHAVHLNTSARTASPRSRRSTCSMSWRRCAASRPRSPPRLSWRARRGLAPRRSGRGVATGRLHRANPPPSCACVCRPPRPMWKNIWLAGSQRKILVTCNGAMGQ